MADMRLHEGFVMAPLLILIVFLGIYPKPMLERIEPSVNALLHVPGFVERQGPEIEAAGEEELATLAEKAAASEAPSAGREGE